MHHVAVALWALVMGILSIVTIVGNLAVLLSYYLDKNIRQPSNYFIFSLAVSDLIIGLEGIPVYTHFFLNEEWAFGAFLCDLWLSVDYIVCLASIYTVLSITVDRYCSVKHATMYRNWRTPRRVLLIIAATWVVPSILFSISIFGYGTFTGTGRILQANECYVQFMTNPYLNMGMYISYYWSTLFVMLYLYWGIYRAAKQLALKSDQKTKRLALLTEMRRPEASAGRTSGRSSSDSPAETADSSRDRKSTMTALPTSSVSRTTASHYIVTNNNNNVTTNGPLNANHCLPQQKANFSTPFSRQEPSSVLEKESTAPCVSPEQSSASEETAAVHPTFKPQISFPFIDADSASSLVGNDDLSRLRSVRTTAPSRRASLEEGIREEAPAVETRPLEEVKVPLIAVQRASTTKGSCVRRLLTAMRTRSRSRRSSRKQLNNKSVLQYLNPFRKKEVYKSRSENRARKALRTITFILGSFIILWTPFYVLATIYGFCESCKQSSAFNLLYTISYYLCYMNSPLNPFCYAMANQQFKKTLTRSVISIGYRRTMVSPLPSAQIYYEESPGIREKKAKAQHMNSYLKDCCRMAAGATASKPNTAVLPTSLPLADSSEPLIHYGYVMLPGNEQETKHLEIEVILRPKNNDGTITGTSFFLDVVCEVNQPANK